MDSTRRTAVGPEGVAAGRAVDQTTEFSPPVAASFDHYMGHVASGFAVTRGENHTLVYANEAFRALATSVEPSIIGLPVAAVLPIRSPADLTTLLDQTVRTGMVARDRRIEPAAPQSPWLSCSIWPEVADDASPAHLVIELTAAGRGDPALSLQREVAERLLLSALREHDAADAAEASRRGAAYLAAEGRRLADSLDERATLAAIAGMSLPYLGAWCIVDLLEPGNVMRRLAVIHPDRPKQSLLDSIAGRWHPHPDDQFGLPAVMRRRTTTLLARVDGFGAAGLLGSDVAATLARLNIGSMMTVPLVVRTELIGAVTFVCGAQARPFTPQDIELAEDLASRSAMALDRARLYGEARELEARADSANQAKSAFLGMVGHELRTPLNAIGGYVDLMDLEIHGPITEAQRIDLGRIRTNQRYLMGLITDVMNFTKLGGGQLPYETRDVMVNGVLDASVELLEPLITQKGLTYISTVCEPPLAIRADRERVIQILVNLLANAIKFTPPGRELRIHCDATSDAVSIHVTDTGIGIPASKLDTIFDPFVQVMPGLAGPEGGIGLGLAISRTLARAMNGELTVTSTLGEGSRFTLRLPRAVAATEAPNAD